LLHFAAARLSLRMTENRDAVGELGSLACILKHH
jgi:hypothetical protein